MLNLPIFGKQKLLLSFEYAIIIAQVAKDQGVELTPEIIKRAEDMILNEFPKKSSQRLAVEMLPNVLSIFETK